MKSDVTIHLDTGAALRGSEDSTDWLNAPATGYSGYAASVCFGYPGEGPVRNARIIGEGTNDGWGHFRRPEYCNGVRVNAPGFYECDKIHLSRLFMAKGAENCLVEGVTLRNPVFWTTHIVGAARLNFTNVKVFADFRVNTTG